jgi:hypothetical protein
VFLSSPITLALIAIAAAQGVRVGRVVEVVQKE